MNYRTLVWFLGSHLVAFTGSLLVDSRVIRNGGGGGGTFPLGQLANRLDAFRNGHSAADKAIHKIVSHPTNKRRVVLMCRNKHYLIMKENGRIIGTKNPRNVKKFGRFELQSYAPGVVRIFNLRTRRFIAIDKKGKAYARYTRLEDTLFKDAEKGRFHTYYSLEHYKYENGVLRWWYLAIKKDGRLKRPSKTMAKHRSIEFLAQNYDEYKQQLKHRPRWMTAPLHKTRTSVRP